MTSAPKRRNFSEEERSSLIALIKEEKILHSSKTDCGNVKTKQKQEAWDRVTKKFNAIDGNSERSVKQLRKLWDNWKTDQKSKLSLAKKSTMRTRGGSAECAYKENPEIEVLLESYVDVEMKDEIDSDTIVMLDEMEQSLSTSTLRTSKITEIPKTCSVPKSDAAGNIDRNSPVRNNAPLNENKIIEEYEENEEVNSEDSQNITLHQLNESNRRKRISAYEEICRLKKRLLLEEHNLKMRLFHEKLEAIRAKKEYYQIKTKNLHGHRHHLLDKL